MPGRPGRAGQRSAAPPPADAAPRPTRRSARVACGGAVHGATPHPQGLRLGDGRVLAEADVVWLPPFEVGTITALGLNYAARLGELALEAGSGRAAGEPRDFRPGGLPDPVQRRGRRHPPGQRQPLWPRQLRVDREPGPRPSRGRGGGRRHVLCQQPERARPAPALWRHPGQQHRARGRQRALQGFLEAKNITVSLGGHPIPRRSV